MVMLFLALFQLSDIKRQMPSPDLYIVNVHISSLDSTLSTFYLDKTNSYDMAVKLVEMFSRDFGTSSESLCYTYTATNVSNGKIDTIMTTCRR